MRRSISFSEGHPPPTHKSGYNEEASSRYNVVTNCVTTAEEENKSNFDKIKVRQRLNNTGQLFFQQISFAR